MNLREHLSAEKFKVMVPWLCDVYGRNLLTDTEVTAQFLDYLGLNPEMVADMFGRLSPDIQQLLIDLVVEGDEAWYRSFFSICTCPGHVVKSVTIDRTTFPPTVSMQILRGRDELIQSDVPPDNCARVAIETLRKHLQEAGRINQK
jgi:hypothetical protein